MYEFHMKKMRQHEALDKARSVGPSYNLDYDRISDEMLKIILDSVKDNGEYAHDIYTAYEDWEGNNYSIDLVDEYGDKEYDDKLLDMLETKLINHKKEIRRALMDAVYDLEYNDAVRFRGYGTFYVKSTNGNDSYHGCKIWAGPSMDSDDGGYFDASDFVEVVNRSNSGVNIFQN